LFFNFFNSFAKWRDNTVEMDNAEKARDFLEAQQHYYRQLRQQKDDMKRFQTSKQQHLDAVGLLTDLPTKVRSAPAPRDFKQHCSPS
jgi:hypothetical protein